VIPSTRGDASDKTRVNYLSNRDNGQREQISVVIVLYKFQIYTHLWFRASRPANPTQAGRPRRRSDDIK